MFFTNGKLAARAKQLEARRYIDMKPITPMVSMDCEIGADNVYCGAPPIINGPDMELGDVFSGRDKYKWLQKKIRLPERREGCEVAGLFDFGFNDDGNLGGFESQLYVNGIQYQAVGYYQKDVFFDNFAGQEVELTFLIWSGIGSTADKIFRHRLQDARVGYVHKAADDFFIYAKTITETMEFLSDNDIEKHELTAALDAAFNVLNWDEDKFYDTVGDALELLLNRLDAIKKDDRVTVTAVGHTHIDVAWLWRLKHTREKSMRSFSTVLRLMEEFDEYIFLQSQPQLYKYIKNDSPEMYARIKTRVEQGRWEADGGMWVEADCNISSGEALVRQFMHGIEFFRNEFGKECEFLWLPDVFGYSWALPQILKLCGIKTFSTTKMSWNDTNVIPNDIFRWRGIDGTEVLTYLLTTPPNKFAIDAAAVTYNGEMLPKPILGTWRKFKNKNISAETLTSYGHGDGGGGVTRDMLKMRRAMDRVPGLPRVTPSTAGEFFRRLHEQVEHTEQYVPVWDGELYLENHRGTYTSQGYNKKMNRRMELDAAQSEWLCSLNMLAGRDYPAQRIYDAWETILLHQFHDIIPGSSIREVYQDSDITYNNLDKELKDISAAALAGLTRPCDGAYTLYNGCGADSYGLVYIPEPCDGVFRDENGETLPAQREGDGWLVHVDLPPLSLNTVTFTPGDTSVGADASDSSVNASDASASSDSSGTQDAFTADMDSGTLETPWYSISWDSDGRLTSIFDKRFDRQILPAGQYGNVFELYEDRPLNYDNWNVDAFYAQKREFARSGGAPELVGIGSQRAIIRFRYVYNHSTFTQDMIVYRHSERIDFVTHADWHEDHRLLKVAFPVDVRAVKATFDIQFGHVERPTHFNTSWDWARFETVGQKWADLSECDYGVSLLNDCKYGYSIHDGVMRLSLLKSGKYPDYACDMGEHDFTYALFPHGGAVGLPTITEAVAFNQPVGVFKGKRADETKQLIFVDGGVTFDSYDNPAYGLILVDAVKKADHDNCLVVRMHEALGARCSATIASDYAIKAYAPCNLLEENTGDVCQGNGISAEFRPFEIKTYKIWF